MVASSTKSWNKPGKLSITNGFKREKEQITTFEKLMKDKFQLSSMGELTFFLGLQVTQKKDGIFISQNKYVAKILKKFNYTNVKSASTLVDLEKPLVKDEDADDVDVYLYRSMIGSLMYLTTSRPDIILQVGDEAVHKELGDRMERAVNTASSLEAEQDSGNINRTQSMATLNELNP
ncbi:uncharacterized mitochondrial protein-like protein [Tanacetum coccineum]|uniref:Uncharacterized mitochondrial protein-like protein n=1 Tax=Tanacetum coccineum TaxID=301880 RepID=A0ABQ4ZNH0_9ASTR